MKEKKDRFLNVRLNSRQALLLSKISFKRSTTKAKLVRKVLFDNLPTNEPELTPKEIEINNKINSLLDSIRTTLENDRKLR